MIVKNAINSAIITVTLTAIPAYSDELCQLSQQRYGETYFDCADSAETGTTRQSAIDQETKESHIFFRNGGADLDRSALAQLTVLVPVLETSVLAQSCLYLVGHSDTSGGASVNHEISLMRAEAVADYLKRTLTNPVRVVGVSAAGETQPLAGIPTTSSDNRRVAIFAQDCPRSVANQFVAQVAQAGLQPLWSQ